MGAPGKLALLLALALPVAAVPLPPAFPGHPGDLRGVAFKGDGFGLGWERKIDGLGPPVLYRGILYAGDGSTLYAIEARTGRVLTKTPGICCVGRPAVSGETLYTGGAVERSGYTGVTVALSSPAILDTSKGTLGAIPHTYTGVLACASTTACRVD